MKYFLSVKVFFSIIFVRFLQISFPVVWKNFFFEVLQERIFECLAHRDFIFCQRTIKRACHCLYRSVFTMQKDNIGERLRDIVKNCGNIQEVWNECILLQKHCSADSRIGVIVADLIL